ncbi:MAG: ATP-binding cassette domain-containing protein [Lachnospiraceae bacterium]|nr:ATP-binding cassette domain-containing protein [Lachnospiraceae bacterium]
MNKWKKTILTAAAVLLWIGLWEFAAYRLNKPVLLPYPMTVFRTLIGMLKDRQFLAIVWGSFRHVTAGFLLALAAGVLLAVISSLSEVIETLLMPGVKLVKTVPVVSFIILLLFFVKPEKIGLVISLLMVFPVVYENVRKGITSTDTRLKEAAKVFRLPFGSRLSCMLIPSMIPYTAAACSAGLSLCWKAGIAAELIAQAPKSIGHELYYSKLYVDAEAVFAWTIIIIAVSVLFEKVFLILFRLLTVSFSNPTLWKHRGRLIRFLLWGNPGAKKESGADEKMQAENAVPDGSAAETARQAGSTSEAAKAGADGTEAAQNAEVSGRSEEETFSANPVLTLDGVGKDYDGRAVLSGISLSLIPGTVTILSGPSGIGKTTLLRILLGLAEPDHGTVTRTDDAVMSAVFQENRLFEQLSASRNVRIIPNGPDRSEADALLRSAGITETEGKAVSAFSGGMKRRVAWCRALAIRSRIILLDEPFTGLDEAKKDVMIRLLKERKGNNAIVIVTHNPSEIQKISDNFERVSFVKLG